MRRKRTKLITFGVAVMAVFAISNLRSEAAQLKDDVFLSVEVGEDNTVDVLADAKGSVIDSSVDEQEIEAKDDIANDEEVTYSPELLSGNLLTQDYKRWASPVYSYLVPLKNGYMRVDARESNEGIIATYYNVNFEKQSSTVVPMELTSFGAFYATASNYYLLVGQANDEQSDSKEVYRLIKYDLSWNRLGSVGLSGCNTTLPFRAGSARIAECGKYLIIRTCHQMYKSVSDGLRHQANLTYQVDTSKMTITNSSSTVLNIGYCSHSFNQFIQIEDNKVVAVDHGDAYPRSIALFEYNKDVTSGKFLGGYSSVTCTDLIQIPGTIGNNSTGASVGGFEISSDAYLVAGNCINFETGSLDSGTRNIYISVKSKTTGKVKTNFLTSYAEGEASATTPQFVKINSDLFLVMWQQISSVVTIKGVQYAFVDGLGNQIGNTGFYPDTYLSDCKPVVSGNKVVWYGRDYSNHVTFYSIPTPGKVTPEMKGFVKRLYTGVLARPAETDGLEYWTKMIAFGYETGASLGYQFVFSNEYQAKKTSDEQFVTMLYKVFMNREADEGGYLNWLNMLEKGMSREFVLKGFVDSPEYKGICKSYEMESGSFVLTQPRDINAGLTFYLARCYTEALNRDYDVEGLNYWASEVLGERKSAREAAIEFILSPEFVARNLSDEEYIKVLYRTYFGREYDQEGYHYWMNNLNNHLVTREDALRFFAMSEEFTEILNSYGVK